MFENACLFSTTLRKSIAVVLTVIRNKERTEISKLYADKAHKPLDLREKKVCFLSLYAPTA